MTRLMIKVGLISAVMAVAILIPEGASAQTLPPFPAIFSGTVVVGGSPAPAGTKLYGQVGTYRSAPSTIMENGRFVGLVVGPPSSELVGQTVYFIYQGIRANETYRFTGSLLDPQTITINFPALPLTGDEQNARLWLMAGAVGLIFLFSGAFLMRRGLSSAR